MTKYRTPILIAGAALGTIVASGCTDLKPIQAQIDDLKSRVQILSLQNAGAKSQADGALMAARSAATAAQHAQSTADAASAMAGKNQQSIEAINEKIDRMFKKSVSK